jgi:hypothetical protein
MSMLKGICEYIFLTYIYLLIDCARRFKRQHYHYPNQRYKIPTKNQELPFWRTSQLWNYLGTLYVRSTPVHGIIQIPISPLIYVNLGDRRRSSNPNQITSTTIYLELYFYSESSSIPYVKPRNPGVHHQMYPVSGTCIQAKTSEQGWRDWSFSLTRDDRQIQMEVRVR